MRHLKWARSSNNGKVEDVWSSFKWYKESYTDVFLHTALWKIQYGLISLGLYEFVILSSLWWQKEVTSSTEVINYCPFGLWSTRSEVLVFHRGRAEERQNVSSWRASWKSIGLYPEWNPKNHCFSNWTLFFC